MSVDISHSVARLLSVMAALRDPVKGCAWDLSQSFETIAPYTVEEAYEVADAIERRDFEDLRDELGDLLLQVVFHARIAEERGLFQFGDVVEQITQKLIRRHPHVFGSARASSPEEVKAVWAEIKAKERADRHAKRGSSRQRHLDAVAINLPALVRAQKLQDRASQVGFDWNDPGKVFEKLDEEVAEAKGALASGNQTRIEDEFGDLLFTMVNLARHAKVDAEAALRTGNAKFERRFAFIEAQLISEGRTLEQTSLQQMEHLWQRAKANEA